MPAFTNRATLSYNGNAVNSNVVTGEIRDAVTITKSTSSANYAGDGHITYTISLVNTSAAAVDNITVTDNLGEYQANAATAYPLTYRENTLSYYQNGVLQTAPTVTGGPPLTISGITIPAGGNVLLIYEADTNEFAPLAEGANIVNTATATGAALASPVSDSAQVLAGDSPELSITKLLSPNTVSPNEEITYTFIIQNSGNLATTAEDDPIVTDTFDPILRNIAVTYNGTAWTEGVNYTYDETTGVFTTLANQIEVSEAAYAQADNGTVTASPGESVITVTGTVG